MTLPSLPLPFSVAFTVPVYTAYQMREYAMAAVLAERARMNEHAVILANTAALAEREACAEMLDDLRESWPYFSSPEEHSVVQDKVLRKAADAIRARKG